ncbi:hypothetical protein RFI_01257 [Reticulomyxa filosa]|uniref:Uncharacterized protein n=1 Tax=Reticulomyxa filosa TaxID=46433 RepID=X6PCK3_RETFI|nr:hypothetical protein RFI_01257 [Reticulomyxa filosa]|eukprot:ETO35804.1 hypothetical protein RFI_01257 [Reticulomyxa filosa]
MNSRQSQSCNYMKELLFRIICLNKAIKIFKKVTKILLQKKKNLVDNWSRHKQKMSYKAFGCLNERCMKPEEKCLISLTTLKMAMIRQLILHYILKLLTIIVKKLPMIKTTFKAKDFFFYFYFLFSYYLLVNFKTNIKITTGRYKDNNDDRKYQEEKTMMNITILSITQCY